MRRISLAGLVFLGVSVAPLFAQQTCQGLTGLALEHATITSATAVPEGPVTGGGRGGVAPVASSVNARVFLESPLRIRYYSVQVGAPRSY